MSRVAQTAKEEPEDLQEPEELEEPEDRLCQAALDATTTQVLGISAPLFSFLSLLCFFFFFADGLSLKVPLLPLFFFSRSLVSGERSVKTSEGGCRDVGTG